MIETKSELLELRDSLGWVDQKDQPATIQMLVSALAITKLEEALHWLNARTNRRESQGVEGTHQGE